MLDLLFAAKLSLMCQWFIDFLTFKAIFTHKVPQSPKVRTHSVFPYFNALSSHNVPQLLTVSFFISMHSAQRVWLLFDRGVDAWSIEGLIVSWIRSWWLVDSWLMEGLKVGWRWGWWSVNRGVDGQSLEELTVGWWRSWWSVDGGVDGWLMEELMVGWRRCWQLVDGGVDG